ncbi:hypothetical protein KAH27_03800 [bacterium]|nr:hypothetical protein [bacterium]
MKKILMFIIVSCCVNIADAVYIPSSLDRGHKLILQYGLQIQGLMFPDSYPYGESWSSARWAESQFNTPNIHETAKPETFGVAPGRPWSRWIAWDDITGAQGPYLYASETPYIPNLISLQAGDELDLSKSSTINTLKNTFDIWETNYPDVIRYGNSYGMTGYDGNDGTGPVDNGRDSQFVNYHTVAKPDMVCFDTYDFKTKSCDPYGQQSPLYGGSPTRLYFSLGRFRKFAMAGNDGTGNRPIPMANYFQCYHFTACRKMGLSEVTLSQFAPLVFGYKILISFFYNNPGPADLSPQAFDGNGDTQPTPSFYCAATNNHQIKKLAHPLERLISTNTYVYDVQGRYHDGSGNHYIPLPSYCAAWSSSADPYITSISASNLSSYNDGLEADVWIGYFTPLHEDFDGSSYNNELYFMLLNGLSNSNAAPEQLQQDITLNFDFGTSGITNLLRLNRETGKTEIVPLIHDGGTVYHQVFRMEGGFADLYKFNDGAPFVGVVPTPDNILPVDMADVTLPVTLTATQFDYNADAFAFNASQWQISLDVSFSSVVWDTGETSAKTNCIVPELNLPNGTYYWHVCYKDSQGIWSQWSNPTTIKITATEAATLFEDNFTVTGGGNANYQYDNTNRQSGILSPIQYLQAGGVSLVTNAGSSAGTVNFNGTDVALSPNHNFTDYGNISLQVEIKRLNNTSWTAVAIGKDNPTAAPWVENGFTIMIYPDGNYYVYDHWNGGSSIAHFYFSELDWAVNPILKIKLVMSQSGGFPPVSDARIALFINDKAYPLNDDHVEYTYIYSGGFTNNYINVFTENNINIDNWKITTPSLSNLTTQSWTSDYNSGIVSSGYKVYTHKVCFATNNDVTINGVTFTGSGSTTSGSDWNLKFANGVIPTRYNIFADWSVNPGVSGNSRGLLQNIFYDWTAAGEIDISGLTPGQKYIFKMYSCGIGGSSDGNRYCYFATSDGGLIPTISQNEFGIASGSPGQILKYEYTASDSGIFSISATPTNYNNANWAWFAFSNEEKSIPEPCIFLTFQLLFINHLRKFIYA